MKLFSKRSVCYLFESAGYADVTVKAFVNTYLLRYWMRLAPLPRGIESTVPNIMIGLGVDNAKLRVNVGNLIITGFKRV